MSLSHLFPKKTTLAGIIVACSFLFLLASPAHAMSSTATQMELIQQLMEMIVALKAQLETLQAQESDDSYTSNTPYSCELSQSLWFGASDATTNGQVGILQKFLTNTGDFTYGKITGLYGPATVSAVQKWQKRNGIISYGTPDTTGYGTVGDATLKAMRKGCVSNTGPMLDGEVINEIGSIDENGIQFQLSIDATAINDDIYILADNLGKFYQVYKDGVLISKENLNISENDDSNAKKIFDSNQVGFYSINEGETRRFKLTVHITPSVSGAYQLRSPGVDFRTTPDGMIKAMGHTSGYVTKSVFWKGSANKTIQASIKDITNSENPTISGTADGVAFVGFSISDEGGKVYGSGKIPVVKGKWSHKVRADLPDGAYEVIVYVDNVEYIRKGFSIGEMPQDASLMAELNGESARVLADGSGKFTISFRAVASGDDMLVKVNQSLFDVQSKATGAGVTLTSTLTSDADTVMRDNIKYYVVHEGEENEFELTSVYRPKYDGDYKMRITGIDAYPESANTKSVGIQNNGEYVLEYATKYLSLKGTSGVGEVAGAPTMTLSASPASIKSGDSVKLSWSSTNATYCSMGDKEDISGTMILKGVEATKTYTMTCTGLGGSVSKSVTVTVNTKTVTAPTLKLSASPLIIVKGGSAKFTWSAQNANYCSMGDKMSTSGSQTITGIDANKTYTVTCYGDGGSVSESFTITVASNTLPPYKNKYDCSEGVWDGNCLGMWDYGNDFGDDKNMCFVGGGLYGTPTTGCVISVPQCPSGSAKATEYIDVRSAPSVAIEELANSLAVTTDIVRKGLLYVWQYGCVEESSVPQTQSCVINDIYVEQVPGYVYYNLYIKTNGGMNDKIENGTLLGITGAESWDNLKFANDTASGLPASTYIANQTLSGTGANYVLSRKNNISLLDPSGNIICSAIGTVSKAKQLSPLASGIQTTNTQCTDLSQSMHRGAESSAVLSLQKFLVSKGLLLEEPTAFYGDLTVGAVKAYQKSIGLPETGMVYEFTRSAIQKETCTP